MYQSMTYRPNYEELAKRMAKDSSNFAHYLGELYIVSDPKNRLKIKEAFWENFHRFMTEEERIKYSFNGA